MRPPILLLLFVLATVHCKGARDSNSNQLLEDNRHHSQGYPYFQDSPIPQTNIAVTSTKTEETTVYVLMPWACLVHNVITAIKVQDYYQKENFCFTLAIILIIGQFHIGLLQMLGSDTIQSSRILKGAYFLSIVIATTFALFSILFSRMLRCKQIVVLTLYIVAMLITGIYDQQLYQSIQMHLFIFSPIIHLYNLKERHIKINYETIPFDEFCSYSTNIFFFACILYRFPQVYFKSHPKDEIAFLADFLYFIIAFYIIFVILPEVKAMWVLISRWTINNLKIRLLGMELQEEICVICLQKMDHFANLYQRIILSPHSKESDLYEAECGHIFHNKCIQIWCNTKSKCPLDNSILRL